MVNEPSPRISNSTTSMNSNSNGISPQDSDIELISGIGSGTSQFSLVSYHNGLLPASGENSRGKRQKSETNAIPPRNTDSTKMMVIPETEVQAYQSQIEQMKRNLEKANIDLAFSQEQNKYLQCQLDRSRFHSANQVQQTASPQDVSVTTAIRQMPSQEKCSVHQQKPPTNPPDWRLVIQEMHNGNSDLMICMPMDETETMMKNVFNRLISMLHQQSSEEMKPFCAILVPSSAVSKCLFTKYFQDKRINTIYTNDDGTPIWAWETHKYPTVGLLTCQCFFTEVGFGRLKLDNIRFFMMQHVDLLVNDLDFVNCIMQLKSINTIIYRILAFSTSMDVNLKMMMSKILCPGYKQMIFGDVDMANAQPIPNPKAILSDKQNLSSLLDRIEFEEEPLASSIASPHPRQTQVREERLIDLDDVGIPEARSMWEEEDDEDEQEDVGLPRNQDFWSDEEHDNNEEEEEQAYLPRSRVLWSVDEDDNDIGLPRPGQQKRQLAMKQEESSQKKSLRMPQFSIWNHAVANGQNGSGRAARDLQWPNSTATDLFGQPTTAAPNGGGGDNGNNVSGRFEEPLQMTSQELHSTDVFESAVQSPAGSLHRTTSPTSSTTTSTSAEGSSSQPRVVDQWSDQTSNSFSSLIFDASENNNSADAVAPNHLASEHQQLQAEQQSVATAVEQQIGDCRRQTPDEDIIINLNSENQEEIQQRLDQMSQAQRILRNDISEEQYLQSNLKARVEYLSMRMNQLEEGQGRMASTDVLLDVDIRLDAVEDRLAGVNMEQICRQSEDVEVLRRRVIDLDGRIQRIERCGTLRKAFLLEYANGLPGERNAEGELIVNSQFMYSDNFKQLIFDGGSLGFRGIAVNNDVRFQGYLPNFFNEIILHAMHSINVEDMVPWLVLNLPDKPGWPSCLLGTQRSHFLFDPNTSNGPTYNGPLLGQSIANCSQYNGPVLGRSTTNGIPYCGPVSGIKKRAVRQDKVVYSLRHALLPVKFVLEIYFGEQRECYENMTSFCLRRLQN